MAATQDAIVEDAPLRRQRNKRLRQAVHRHKAVTRQGIQERLFTLAFSGLVYPQIWEDPVVDLEAMRLKEGDRLVAIASGGCNVLSYLAAAPISVTAIDLNPAHVALNKLKLAALSHLPDYAAFRTFFADANRQQNIAAYFDYLRPHLDAATRKYWESRDRIGRKRIGYFGTNVYRHGLLGNFIAAGHLLARVHGRNPRRLLAAKPRASSAASSTANSRRCSASGTSAGCSTSLRRCSASAFRRRSSRRSRVTKRAWPTCCWRAWNASPATST